MSEENYKSLFDGSAAGMAVYQNNRCVLANPSFCRLTGYSLDELLSLPEAEVSGLVHPDDRAVILERSKDRLAGREMAAGYEFRLLHRDGAVLWVEGCSSVVDYGGQAALQITVLDITARRRADESLRESQKRYHNLFDTMAQGVVYQNREGRIILANPAAEQILGLSLDQMTGSASMDHGWKSIREDGSAFPGEEHPSMVALRTGKNVNNVVMGVYNFRTEEHRWIKVNAVPQFLPGEESPYQVYTTFDNITELKKAEEALRKSASRFRSLFDSTSEGIALHDVVYDDRGNPTDYIVTDVNPAYSRHTDISRENAVNRRASELYGAGAAPYLETFADVAATGKPTYFETYFPPMKKHFRISVFSPGKGQFATVFEDITSRKRDEEERQKLEKQLQIRQRMDSLGTLAGGVAHDFNNLLSGILGNISLLSIGDDNLSQNQRDLVEEAVSSCHRAADLVKQFQMLSRMPVFEKAPVDVHEIAREVFGLLSRTTDRLIDKVIGFEPGEHFVMVDPSSLNQVFLNLGTNAIRAIEEKGARRGDYLRIRAESAEVTGADKIDLPEGDYVHILFEDSGPGMSEEVAARAFDPMFTTREKGVQKGQGLGLAMVYNIVTRACKGHIDVESARGKGATFHIYLPRVSPAEIARKAEGRVALGGDETILVVDDEKVILDFSEKLLIRYGYRVLTAKDGVEGLKIYREKRDAIDAVLLDLVMPLMTGKEVLRGILDIDPEAKVIVFTGQSEESATDESLSRARGIVIKPFEPERLLHTLRQVLDGRSEKNLADPG